MERLASHQKPAGLTGSALRTWGIFFLVIGIIGRGVLQTRLLGIGRISSMELLELMQSSNNMMIFATLALVLQAMETCAVPIFAFLLVEGFQHTSNFWKYLLRVLGVAALSEIPYNLAIGGKLLDFSTRNPVFGMVLALILLYFYSRFAENNVKNVAIKILLTLAGLLWPGMLSIEGGTPLIILVCVVWLFRRKPMARNMIGATAAIVCTLLDPFYLAAPMGFLAVHFHNGEQGEENRVVNYLAYPAILLVIGLVATFMM